MFTGLIRTIGTLNKKESRGRIIELTIAAGKLVDEQLAIGDSVAVNGLCLTVTGIQGISFTVQAVSETQARAAINDWQQGQKLNLERPVTLQNFLDGHLVTGHVDDAARVVKIDPMGEAKKITLSCPANLSKYIAEKGSITLDGISLTVAAKLSNTQFTVAVIPHTFNNTIAKEWKSGQAVHLEVDIVARYLEGLMQGKKESNLDMNFLAKYGF